MNLPNKLTMFRVILIPFFIVFLLVPITPYDKWIALGIFVIASLTDLLDGKSPENIIWSPISANLWIRWQISCWCVLH